MDRCVHRAATAGERGGGGARLLLLRAADSSEVLGSVFSSRMKNAQHAAAQQAYDGRASLAGPPTPRPALALLISTTQSSCVVCAFAPPERNEE